MSLLPKSEYNGQGPRSPSLEIEKLVLPIPVRFVLMR